MDCVRWLRRQWLCRTFNTYAVLCLVTLRPSHPARHDVRYATVEKKQWSTYGSEKFRRWIYRCKCFAMQIRGLDEFAVFTEMEFDYSRVQYRSHVYVSGPIWYTTGRSSYTAILAVMNDHSSFKDRKSLKSPKGMKILKDFQQVFPLVCGPFQALQPSASYNSVLTVWFQRIADNSCVHVWSEK